MAGVPFVQDQRHVDQKGGGQPKQPCADARVLAMEDPGCSSSTRITKGLLAAGSAGIELGPLANDDAAGLTVGSTSPVQGPHLGRTGGVLRAGGVREPLDLALSRIWLVI